MLRALVPVDGSDCSLAAVRHVIKLVRDREPLDIHLFNAQPPLHGDVTAFVAPSVVRGFHADESEKALAPARALLDAARIAYSTHAVVGHAAQAIVDWAMKLGCDKIIMGTRGHGAVTQLLIGSVTHETIHRIDPSIPITLVKHGAPAPLERRR
jgi:nucleotide-binding universal stress UspA family protein